MSRNSANGSTRRWREVRGEKLKRDGICEWREQNGERCLERATEVDHIVPLKDGGTRFDWGNLRSLCGRHHDIRHGKRPRRTIDPATGWAE